MQPWYLRVFLRLLTTCLYRVEVLGGSRIPASGGALLVSNHLSFVDVLLILSTTRRHIRFILPEEVCRRPLLRPWLKLLGVIPVPVETQEEQWAEALRQASDAIRTGELVGLFAERSISRLGVMLSFCRDFERVMQGATAPIIPVCLDGLWGSIFSYDGGKFFWKLPRRIPYPVSVSFGEHLSATASAFQLAAAIRRLNTEAWSCRRRSMHPLGRAFVRRARSAPFKFLFADATVPKLSAGGALVRTVLLARRFRQPLESQKMVGILLPPSVAGTLANLAVLVAGKIPVNLNYTLANETLASCAQQCELKTIVTSRKFLQRLKLPIPFSTLVLEDVIATISWYDRICALLLACLAPMRLLEKAVGCAHPPGLDDLATVIFSSGSTGEPKGVMLSHYNLTSNAQQLCQAFHFSPQTRFLGVLPFFHSFGFTATLVVPATCGITAVYHPDPREAKAIGELVHRYSVNSLMATPAFLNIYLGKVEPAQFQTIRFVLAGAEKMPTALADAFEKQFGIRPVEGYGCTECAPAVAVNVRDFREAALVQIGNQPGSIGRPLPGVSVKIVDLETGAEPPPGKPGLLLVRGPNVMQGYLNRPEKTAEVLHDGWYQTGDIAALNEDGFLRITDRLSRFSKIGGEMVPHIMVEEKLHQVTGAPIPSFVVTGVPDEKKGERLVVFHTLPAEALAALLTKLPQLGLPNLWIPKPNQFFVVDEIPMTGTGKLALQKIRELAVRVAENPEKGTKEAGLVVS